jgi:hypothetical protein
MPSLVELFLIVDDFLPSIDTRTGATLVDQWYGQVSPSEVPVSKLVGEFLRSTIGAVFPQHLDWFSQHLTQLTSNQPISRTVSCIYARFCCKLSSIRSLVPCQ